MQTRSVYAETAYRIVGHDRRTFDTGLRYQHAVEWLSDALALRQVLSPVRANTARQNVRNLDLRKMLAHQDVDVDIGALRHA